MKKLTKKSTIIIGIIIVAAIIAALVFMPGAEFRKVKKKAIQISGRATSGKNYFTIDTYPEEYKNMDAATVAILRAGTEENALEAIKYANEALGFSGSLYQDMISTSAIMGHQSEENKKYKVTWRYVNGNLFSRDSGN